MTIEPIGRTGVVLYLTPADLARRGLSPGGLTLDQALELTREACRRAGVPLDGAVEIEAYPEYRGVLVFARRRAPLWFSFDGLEPLLETAMDLRAHPVDGSLWWREGRYWLSLPPADERAAAVCRERGRLRREGPGEGARLLYPHHGLWHLCRHFLRLHLENL